MNLYLCVYVYMCDSIINVESCAIGLVMTSVKVIPDMRLFTIRMLACDYMEVHNITEQWQSFVLWSEVLNVRPLQGRRL